VNRQEKREKNRKTNKLQNWLNNLTPDQKKIIEMVIEEQIKRNDETTEKILEDCIKAALIKELNIIDTEKVINSFYEYLEEIKNMLEMKGDYLEMREKKYKAEVIQRAKELLNQGFNMSTGVDEFLKVEFPKVTMRDLTLWWSQAKIELNPKESVKDKDIKINIPASEEEKEEHLKTIITKSEELKEIEEAAKTEVAEPKFLNPCKPVLKVVNTIQEIQGEYGLYIKSAEGVKTGLILYENIEDVEKEITLTEGKYAVSQKEIETEMIELEERMERLKGSLDSLEKSKKKKLKVFEELKQVFNM
jgi:hypothetical protein